MTLSHWQRGHDGKDGPVRGECASDYDYQLARQSWLNGRDAAGLPWAGGVIGPRAENPKIVEAWRAENPKIVEAWRSVETAFLRGPAAARDPHAPCTICQAPPAAPCYAWCKLATAKP